MGCGYFSGRYRQQLKCHVCLLVGLRPPTPHRSLRSLCRRGFVHYVRLRHYRSSLFCGRKIIPSHSFAALTALVVRHVNGNVALLVRRVDGFVDQPRLASTSRRTPPVGALACAPGRGTLPPVGFRGNAPDRRRHLPLPGGDGAAEAASDENRAEAAVAPDAGRRAEVAGAPAFDQFGFADQGA